MLPWVEGKDVTAANIAALQAVCLLLLVDMEVVAVHRGVKGLVDTNLQGTPASCQGLCVYTSVMTS